ncbi:MULTISPECIES: hypothetical protein [unclassified Halorubrum]|uniref:DUF7547 family protein n=1 Tax=unclassified Halorubrum TaxID=2642239 RepID=UPI000B98EDFC|nr:MULTISPECIES: hypothetical protein [unclassified Halorubrum]OYR39176.1 hypothetical protein DJ75_17045 [Halorubrum sp. Eb13]OYR46441.1 hypothetical protein DJ81_02925 [Halorubrum sp. Hd13]OYR53094.1 hypothetical protein DJ73_08990 [Halorubrum sp. Ea1]
MSSRDDRRDDELEERLDELEDVLTELRRDLGESERDRRGPPRPPRLSELLRFTEQYTIPTVIALLETTIKSLELLRGTLRLADPGRSLADESGATADRLADVRDGASAGLARSLSELRTALSEADLPEEAASRSIITDARDLTAEIESRIEEGRREADAARRPGRDDDRRKDRGAGGPESDARDGGRARDDDSPGRDRGVRIDVTDPDAEPEASGADEETEDDPAPEVDVESELESIKRQIDGDEADDADAVDEADASDDAGAGSDAGDPTDADGSTDDDRDDAAEEGDGDGRDAN